MTRYTAGKVERFIVRGKSGTVISPIDYTTCRGGVRYKPIKAVKLPGKKEDAREVSTSALFRPIRES